eukprot:scaffold49946_cov74-Phaeocystis_antarctica.AAC.5
MEFKNCAVLLVAREYSWVLACVKSRCKEHKGHGTGTTGKRGAKGPNSLVNRRALPVASPMGWESSRSGCDGGGGGGGACGKQNSQPGLVLLLLVCHSIDVPSGTIPSGELLPQYRAPFTVR